MIVLFKIPPVVEELFELFNDHELYIVGGWIRSTLLGVPTTDIDLATSAHPDKIMDIVRDWADELWEVGKAFGTIAMIKNGQWIEITTFREDSYDGASRKPTVNFGTSLNDDLKRRDFTVNAMAVGKDGILIDPFNGYDDLLVKRTLRTPIDPVISISDDPLRILRGARFVSSMDLTVDRGLHLDMIALRHKLNIVSKERISGELEKLITLDNPIAGLSLLEEIGILNQFFIPNLVMLKQIMEAEKSHGLKNDLLLRLAALLHDDLDAKFKLRSLRFPNSVCSRVAKILDLHVLVEHDCDARAIIVESGEDVMRVAALSGVEFPEYGMDKRIKRLLNEDLSDPLTGEEIMSILCVKSGPIIGTAKDFLRYKLYVNGPMTKEEAKDVLISWKNSQIGGNNG